MRADKQLSAATKSMFEVLVLMIINLLANRLNLNSANSNKPTASDPDRKRQPVKKTGKKAGGQIGHIGTILIKVDNPDRIELINIDRRRLPAGQYHQVGFETRYLFEIDISRIRTEYRTQVMRSDEGP